MPEIQPDFTAPGMKLLLQAASWFLGLGTVIAFIAFTAVILLIVFKGFGNQGAQQFAGRNVLWFFLGLVAFGSITTLFAFTLGLDLGI